MDTLEIVLLIVGGLILFAGYFVPFGAGEADKDTKKLVETEVKNTVNMQMEVIKEKIDDIVDETVNYAVEKTERAMERVSNEKIMAVNEYSDTVLEEINKNHKEVMFLYDMLNDKHKNLTTAANEVEKTVKEAEQTAKELKSQEADEKKVVSKPKQTTTSKPVSRKSKTLKEETKTDLEDEFVLLSPQTVSAKKVIKSKAKPNTGNEGQEPDISFTSDRKKNGNNNERILEMHNQGKSNVAIAKELGLGVGEVKLVIDLFEGQM